MWEKKKEVVTNRNESTGGFFLFTVDVVNVVKAVSNPPALAQQ